MNDLRPGLWLLRKDKAFTPIAVLTLAVCIGANTALFSIVHNILLKVSRLSALTTFQPIRTRRLF